MITSNRHQVTLVPKYGQILSGICHILLLATFAACSDGELRSGDRDGAVVQDGLSSADSTSVSDGGSKISDSAAADMGPSPDSGTPAEDGTASEDAAGTVPARDRPFDPIHPIYQPIPANCQLAPYSTEGVNYIINNGHNTFSFDTEGETPPIYVGAANDPLWTLQIHGQAFNVHAPTNIQAGTGSDYPLIILDESSTACGRRASIWETRRSPATGAEWESTPMTAASTAMARAAGLWVRPRSTARTPDRATRTPWA
jgi:hypothetical protein